MSNQTETTEAEFVPEPPRITVGVGYTRNMGNFESARVDISVEDSVRTGENVKTAYKRIKDFVEAQLIKEVTELEEELKTAQGK